MKILILEDDPIIAADLKKICENEGHEARTITSLFQQTFDVFDEFKPELLLCDFRLTETITSPDILHKLLGNVSVHVIFITAYYDSTTINEINQIKPDGYLIKPFREDQVIALIRSVGLLVDGRNKTVEDLGISERELEILVLLSRGFTSKDISKALKISNHTVDTHRRNLLQKTQADNTMELIDISREYQLLS